MVASTLTLVKEFSSNCVEESVANEFLTASFHNTTASTNSLYFYRSNHAPLLFYLCRRVDSRVEILFGKAKIKTFDWVWFEHLRETFVSNILYKNEIHFIMLNFPRKNVNKPHCAAKFFARSCLISVLCSMLQHNPLSKKAWPYLVLISYALLCTASFAFLPPSGSTH